MKRVLGILLTVVMTVGCCYFSSTKKEEVVEVPQIIETKVDYLTDEQLSTLYSCKADPNKDTTINLTQEEAWMLMKLAQCEAGGCVASQYHEMMIVINRVKSDEFPNTIEGVIFQDNPSQFSVVKEGKFAKAEPTIESHLALAMVERGVDWSEGAVWVEASSNSSDSWHSQNKEFLYELYGQKYYK